MRTPAEAPRATGHDHDACVEAALAAAERICALRKARLTPNRRRVLELIWNSHDVVGAYDILAELQKEDPSAKPPTVYRALDFLMDLGLIHRIESANGFTRCEAPERAHVCQFLICDSCGLVEELHSTRLAGELDAQAENAGFQPGFQIVEVHGRCRSCQA